jgi:anti-anti-sigma factor
LKSGSKIIQFIGQVKGETMLDIEHEEKEGVAVVYFFGKMDTRTSPEAEKYINQLIDEGDSNILMNFEELDFISSTGLRVILATGKKLMVSNGKLTLCNPNITVNDVLKMSGFNRMFGVFDTEEEALASY